jgi:hypothetical protein
MVAVVENMIHGDDAGSSEQASTMVSFCLKGIYVSIRVNASWFT